MAAAGRGLQDLVMNQGQDWSQVRSNAVANLRPDASELQAHNFLHHAKALFAAFDAELVPTVPMWLVVHEVGFHLDEDLAEDVGFVVWHVAGAPKAVDFPNMGCGVVMSPGDVILFDGMQPHGVRLPHYAGQEFTKPDECEVLPQTPEDLTVFYAIDLPLTPVLDRMLGIRRGTRRSDRSVRFETDNASGRTRLLTN